MFSISMSRELVFDGEDSRLDTVARDALNLSLFRALARKFDIKFKDDSSEETEGLSKWDIPSIEPLRDFLENLLATGLNTPDLILGYETDAEGEHLAASDLYRRFTLIKRQSPPAPFWKRDQGRRI